MHLLISCSTSDTLVLHDQHLCFFFWSLRTGAHLGLVASGVAGPAVAVAALVGPLLPTVVMEDPSLPMVVVMEDPMVAALLLAGEHHRRCGVLRRCGVTMR